MKIIICLVMAASIAAFGGGTAPASVAAQSRPEKAGAAAAGLMKGSANFLAPAYGWTKTWGGNTATAQADNVVVDGAGNRYVTGQFVGTVAFNPAGGDLHTSHGAEDAFLSKFDSTGSFQWVKTWGGTGRDVSGSIVLDSSGSVYVAGNFQNTVDFNPSGGASHTSNSGSSNNIFLSKFAADGTFQWVKTWGPSDAGAEGYSIAIDASNNVYVVGDFSGTSCDFNPWGAHDVHTNHPTDPSGPFKGKMLFDAYLSKFDSNGNFQWAKTWGGEGYDDGPGVAVDHLGNVYVGGMYASQTINFDPAGGSGGLGHPAHDSGIVVDVFLSKFNSSGIFQWVRTWGGPGVDDVGETVAVDTANNVYLGGRFKCTNCDFNPGGTPDLHSSNGDLDSFVSKYDSNGNFKWARTWGGTGADAIGGLVTDALNNVYAAGVFSNTVDFGSGSGVTSHGLFDAFLIKFASSGAFQGAQTWGGSGSDGANRINRDAAGNVYVTGWFSNTVDFDPGTPVENHTALGTTDAFLTMYAGSPVRTIFLPLIVR